MRLRALDANGDFRFGSGLKDFYVNERELVAQKVKTRLNLYRGDFFLNLAAGTVWRTDILGARTNSTRDPALRARILGTPGCTGITAYTSQINRQTRGYSVQCTISTAFGQTLVATSINLPNADVRVAR